MTEPALKLLFLGGVELRGAPRDAADRLLAQSKVVGFLAYLALSPPGRLQRRDRLVGLLWPELDQAHARAALRKVLHAARDVLGGDVLVTRGDEEVGLAPELLWCDVTEFTVAAESGRLARAIELYQGDLLDGFYLAECSEFGMWLDSERALARERASAAALALSSAFERDKMLTQAVVMAKKAVRFVWTDERVLRRAVSMLDRIGDRAGALWLYEDFARRLKVELEAEPSAETKALAQTLRTG